MLKDGVGFSRQTVGDRQQFLPPLPEAGAQMRAWAKKGVVWELLCVEQVDLIMTHFIIPKETPKPDFSRYPGYATYETLKKRPTVMDQEFVSAFEIDPGKLLYPRNPRLEHYFSSAEESLRFGAAQFCGFLQDTISVEHHVVIPAVLAIGKTPFKATPHAILEMYKIITDEGHHAAQALSFCRAIEEQFNVDVYEEGHETPLFVVRLGRLRENLKTNLEKHLFDMMSGVVTETRISIELGQFAHHPELMDSVKAVCRSHQEDEHVHASQFRALGIWIWSQSDAPTRRFLAEIFAQITIARSLPDPSRIGYYFSQATQIPREESQRIIDSIYTPDVLRSEMMIAIRPTLRFLRHLGALEFQTARDVFTEAGVDYAE